MYIKAGLEKVLRLLQSFAQVVIALSFSASDAAPWVQARSHFVVGRRFLRITKWVDAWQVAQEQFYNASQSRVRMLLAVTKFSCLGMYLFLEMFTIVSLSFAEKKQRYFPFIHISFDRPMR